MTVADTFPDQIRDAYREFKGSCETKSESYEMLKVVDTARTNGVRLPNGRSIRNAVHVHLSSGITSVPDVVERAADRHNLVEVAREHRYDSDEIDKISFIREEEAQLL